MIESLTYLHAVLSEVAELDFLATPIALPDPDPKTVVEPVVTQTDHAPIEPDCDRQSTFYPTLYL